MSAPTGTVTFLFTDVEGSTRRWEVDAEAMSRALGRHDEILIAAIEEHRGHVFATGGDGFAVAFATADDALGAARSARRELEHQRNSGEDFDLAVRMGLHTGTAEERDGDYFGPVVNRAARIMAAGHGGQILLSNATATMLSDRTGLVDLGEHRLRDLLDPAHLHLADTDPTAHPALRTLDVHDHNLPVLRSSVFGLDDAVRTITTALHEHDIVTLTGIGGVGKTRLALEVAARVIGDHDLTRFVDLSHISDGSDVAQALAGTLALETAELDAIVGHLGVRDSLLVVDNCEHVVDDVHDLLETILARCPDCHVLATSREPLGLDGEHVRPVRSLTGDAASKLFVDRSLAVRPDLELHAAQADIAEICERLDGIPLAIELAAARVTHMSPADIANHLDERFSLLSGGRRRARQRQQTLQATMDWSHDLLEPDEQELLRAVSVFTGGFDAEAAAAVWERPIVETLQVLGALVDRSMLTVETVDASTRYGMLETVRLYAQDRLVAAGEAARRRALHAECFEQRLTAVPVGEMLDDSLGTHRFHRPTNVDLANHMALLDWLDGHGELTRLGRAAPRALFGSHARTWGDETDRYFGRHDVAEELDGDERALYWAASSFNSNLFGRFEDQLRFAEHAVETATDTVRIVALTMLANAASIFDPDRVGALLDEADALAEPDHPQFHHTIRGRRIDPLIMTGDFDSARPALEQEWRILHAKGEEGANDDLAIEASELLYVELVTGNDDRALELAMSDPVLHPASGRTKCTAAVVLAGRGDGVESARLLLEAAERLEAFPMRLLPHEFTIAAAMRAVHGGDPDRACRLLSSVPAQVRTPAAYQLLAHARRLVRGHLSREQVEAIRAEMAGTDPVAVRRAELARLREEANDSR